MLQLTRKPGQRIFIGDDIEVVVMSVSRSEARIAIKAPRTVSILRGEIVERIAKENVGAAGSAKRQVDALKKLVQTAGGEKDETDAPGSD